MENLIFKNDEESRGNKILNRSRISSRTESFKRQNAVKGGDAFVFHDSESLSIKSNSESSDHFEENLNSPEKTIKLELILGDPEKETEVSLNRYEEDSYLRQWVLQNVTESLEEPHRKCANYLRNSEHCKKSQNAPERPGNCTEISDGNYEKIGYLLESQQKTSQNGADSLEKIRAYNLKRFHDQQNSVRGTWKNSSDSFCNGPVTPNVRRPLSEDNPSHCRRVFSQMSQNLERSVGRFCSSEHHPSTETLQRRPRLSSYTSCDRPVSRTDSNSLSFSCKILPSYQVLRSTSVGENNSCVASEDSGNSRNSSRPILTRRNSLVFRHQFDLQECLKKKCEQEEQDLEASTPLNNSGEPEDSKKSKIPDGGWGWVVVLSSLVISMVADGISFSFGLLYIEFLNHYQESKSKTSWIGSLFMAVPLLLGPVCSILVDKYGCRSMTMLGGVISGTGFILSSISTTIEQQFLTFGVIAGSGLGLCYLTAVVSVAVWFDKKRTLATSLGACGTGIGTFVYAPMTTFFIEQYGWRGAILLLAGTFFNLCVCGAVMRDPEWWILEQRKMSKLSRETKCASSTSISGRSTSDFPGIEELRRMLKSGQTQEYVMTEMTTSTTDKRLTINPIAEEKPEESVVHTYCSVVNIPTFVKQQEKVPFEVLESLSNNKRVFNVILKNYPSLLMCRSISDHGELPQSGSNPRLPVTMSLKVKPTPKCKTPAPELVQSHDTPPPQQKNGCLVSRDKSDQHAQSNPNKAPPVRTDSGGSSGPKLKRQTNIKDYTFHYLKDIRIHRNSLMHRGAALNINKYHLRASSCPNIYRTSITTIAKNAESKKCCSEWADVFSSLLDFSMFLELHFLLLSLATILLFTWFIVPYFYLSDFVINNGMTDAEASGLLSMIGVANTFGMIFLGWAGDRPWMNVTKTYAFCLCGCGISTGLMPLFMDNYWALLGVSASFGMFFASNYSFTPTILVEMIPLNRFTTAYGLILLCQGIGNLLGPPLAGYVFDVMNVWDYSFYLAGFWIVISGLLMAIIPMTKNRLILGTGSLEKDKETSSS